MQSQIQGDQCFPRSSRSTRWNHRLEVYDSYDVFRLLRLYSRLWLLCSTVYPHDLRHALERFVIKRRMHVMMIAFKLIREIDTYRESVRWWPYCTWWHTEWTCEVRFDWINYSIRLCILYLCKKFRRWTVDFFSKFTPWMLLYEFENKKLWMNNHVKLIISLTSSAKCEWHGCSENNIE